MIDGADERNAISFGDALIVLTKAGRNMHNARAIGIGDKIAAIYNTEGFMRMVFEIREEGVVGETD